MNHSEKAAELFLEGYNCAQAVAVAFCDVTGLDEKATAKMVSAYGGGMGGLREVCGAVSGMLFILSNLYGYDDPKEEAGKKQLYAQVQSLAQQFKEQHTTIICRDLLGNLAKNPTPSPRTPEYYAKRPCVRFVMTAAQLMDEFIAENPL